MRQRFLYLLTIGLLLGLSSNLYAQLRVRISLDTATVMIGDHLTLGVDISAEPGTVIEQIDYGQWEEEGPVELLDLGPLNTIRETPQLLLQQEARYISFDSGYHRLPPLAVYFRAGPGQPLDTAYSSNLGLQVFTLPVQSEAEIRDNKDIIEEPFNWRDAWPLYVLVGVLLLLGLLWHWWRRRGQAVEEVLPPPPPPPAHEVALEKLATLAEDRAWERGEIKSFQSDLTYVLREYFDGRFDLNTLEATTPETLAQLPQAELPEDAYDKIKHILEQADLVKFAKATPPEQVHPDALATVHALVEATKAAPEPDPEPKDSEDTPTETA